MAQMDNFVVLVDYAQLNSLPIENREARLWKSYYERELDRLAQRLRIEELVEKNEEKSKIIENLSTQNAELENKIKQKEDSEKNDVEVEKIKQELNKSSTLKNEVEKLKIELKRSDTEKDELKKILSEKEEVIFSQNQTIKRKNQNLNVLLDQIHKSCTNLWGW